MNLKNLNETLERKAQEYSQKAHKGQYRKFAGEPYSEHPKRVAEIVRRFKSSKKIENLVSAAFLHDTIEDTNTTIDDLRKMFGGLTADLVRELTSDKEEIEKTSKSEYLKNKMKDMSSWGLVIKLADRLDNVSDLKNAKPEFADKYKKETEYLLKNLERDRKLTNTQKRIIDNIREKLDELEDKVNEEFVDSEKRGSHYFEIFKNPSRNELFDITKQSEQGGVRFIMLKSGMKFYAFPVELLHADAMEKLGLDYNNTKEYAYGIGRYRDGKLEILRMSSFNMSKRQEKFYGKFLHLGKNEEFETALKSEIDKEYYEIYKNPTRRELEEVGKQGEVRIIIDKRSKDLYVFDANLLHMEAEKRLSLPGDDLIKTATAHLGKGRLLMNNYLKNEVKRNKKLMPLIDKYFVKLG